MIALLVLAGISFAAALTVLADTATPAARRRNEGVALVRRFVGGRRSRRWQVPAPAMSAAERIGGRLASDKFKRGLPERLAAAGYAGRITPEAFLALRFGLTALGVLLGLCIGAMGTVGGKTLLLCIVFGSVGFFGPSFVLTQRARSRRQQIHAALPDALDLLAVTVEAGLGLFGAIERLVATTTGPLADEFSLVLTELRVGDSSERALKRMATRLQSPEIGSFVRSLIQGEQLGLSLAHTLRNLADDVRRKRRALAEELAQKAPVKMLFPTALFIFPALFVIILGPAIIELKNYL